MSKKYLESLEKIKQEFNCDPEYYGLGGAFEILESALHRLESIDNAEPSEALSVLKATEKYTGIDLTVVKNALLKAQEQEKELKSEINVLFSYMEFTKLFFEIFNLNYSNETFTLSLIPTEQYNIENVDLKICLIKEDADKILKVAELLEKEVEE